MQFHEISHDPFVYLDGCALCDAIECLKALFYFPVGAPWADDEKDEAEAVRLIRYIKQAKGLRQTRYEIVS